MQPGNELGWGLENEGSGPQGMLELAQLLQTGSNSRSARRLVPRAEAGGLPERERWGGGGGCAFLQVVVPGTAGIEGSHLHVEGPSQPSEWALPPSQAPFAAGSAACSEPLNLQEPSNIPSPGTWDNPYLELCSRKGTLRFPVTCLHPSTSLLHQKPGVSQCLSDFCQG